MRVRHSTPLVGICSMLAGSTPPTARQREIYERRMKRCWLRARIDRVDHKVGGGNGVLTVTLLCGFDPSRYGTAPKTL